MEIELFSEFYSSYYNTVFFILKEAANRELKYREFERLVYKASCEHGFSDTTNLIVLNAIKNGIEPEIEEDKEKDTWPLFSKVEDNGNDYNNVKDLVANNGKLKSRLNSIKSFPLSTIEKMWLKSIYSDPRIRLFVDDFEEIEELKDIEPLFDWNDYVLFDKYDDGDPYTDDHYIEIFRKVLDSVHNKSRLEIKCKKPDNNISYTQDGRLDMKSDRGIGTLYIDSDYLEYSERDDRFRLIGNNPRFGRNMVNIASIVSCKEVEIIDTPSNGLNDDHQRQVIFELTDDRDTLERFLLAFSHYEKELDYIDRNKQYRIKLIYDETDETDLVIRTLSFGPYVKVKEPEAFIGLIRERLKKQIAFED